MFFGSRRARSDSCALTRCCRAGIGDTTEPLPPSVAKAMSDYCQALGTVEGYSGYDPPIEADVKAKVAEVMYKGMVDPSEVFVSDGSKCDLGRLQVRPYPTSSHHTQPNLPPALQLMWSADAERVRVGCCCLRSGCSPARRRSRCRTRRTPCTWTPP